MFTLSDHAAPETDAPPADAVPASPGSHPKNPHAGHRSRMLRRLLKKGADAVTPVECLEILLFETLPRRNTNPAAHGLADRLGSLGAVLRASKKELRKTDGIGPAGADLLSSVLPFAAGLLTETALEAAPKAVRPERKTPADTGTASEGAALSPFDPPPLPDEFADPAVTETPGRWTLLAAADFRFRFRRECAAVISADPPAWLPARSRKRLFALLAKQNGAPCLAVLSPKLAAKLGFGKDPAALRALFPPTVRLLVVTEDRRMEEV